MLDLAGAVEAEWPDEGVAAHYGDPMREQRVMSERPTLVDRSNRGVIKITGPDRLSWLHSLTSQHLERLSPGSTQQALVLSPQGHVEHHLTLTDDGAATWIHVEPHTAAGAGRLPQLDALHAPGRGRGPVRLARRWRRSPPGDGAAPVVETADAKAVMQGPFGTDLIVEPDVMGKLAATYPVAGLWAFEAARIAAHIPRPGLDTDHRTLPHEIGLIETAVHLNKGCYRGQETVARIQNVGRPPRRLVFLHLDGSVDRLPAHGAPITTEDGTEVGFVGSAARHYELGPIGLGLVKRTVPADAALLADGVAAAQEVIVSPDAGANVKVTLRRDSVPPPPSGRKML